ncbi:signal peptide peptidase SppA [Pseudohaliea rubra]|uniref:Protease IV n=1 Tax=Pseudohaliea rubra DSM 19751 TaxID=1265313 RepID=A0A095VV02_9GAMM|nr:signal peptide peptidase SppA [Pseudohaliea rubra]KGE05292.1 Protease IV [Pseudohaliea rubra DSM 19751]
MAKASFLRRFFRGLWRGITVLRLALANLLFLVALLLLYFALTGGPSRELPERAALLLAPAGRVVDERSRVEPLALLGDPSPATAEVRLRDLIDAVDRAADDPAISALVIDTDDLLYLGLSRAQELAPALERFRAGGKPIVALGDYFTQDQYLLAVQADELILHPHGALALEGFASYQNYFRDALDKLAVNMHVFRAGEHKAIAEPLTRMDMSEDEKTITRAWLDDLWSQYTALVEARRALPAGAVAAHINSYPTRLAAEGGDPARLALADGLIDRLLSREAANDYLVELVGAADDKGRFEAVPFERYLARRGRPPAAEAGKRVAVVTAAGPLFSGERDPGAIGAETLVRQLRQVASEPDVAAIVLRIDSPGGSAFGAEVVRAGLEDLARRRELPVVVSMGRVAASAGYYIAAPADEIWATPATITGSIGVFLAFPTVEELFERAGIATDGVGTTERAGALRLDRPLQPALAETLQLTVNDRYRKFVAIVASGRDMAPAQVEAVAEGRVWSAPAAKAVGLVDELGSLAEAARAAAGLAGLDEGEYRVDYVNPPQSPRQLLLQTLADRLGITATLEAALPVPRSLRAPLTAVRETLDVLEDPADLYMLCLACAP